MTTEYKAHKATCDCGWQRIYDQETAFEGRTKRSAKQAAKGHDCTTEKVSVVPVGDTDE